jgi:hypothetical protein
MSKSKFTALQIMDENESPWLLTHVSTKASSENLLARPFIHNA